MALETGTYVDDLNISNPVGASDLMSQGDDHLRLIKKTLKNTFPGAGKPFYFPSTLTSKTAAYTVQSTEDNSFIPCDLTAGAFTVTLPTASSSSGFSVVIVKTDVSSNVLTIDGAGADTINGAASVSVSAIYGGVILWCDGSEWFASYQSNIIPQPVSDRLTEVAALTPTLNSLIAGDGSSFVMADKATVRTFLDVATITGPSVIGNSWTFTEFLKLYNTSGTANLKTFRSQMASDNSYNEHFVNDAGTATGHVRSVTHDASGVLLQTSYIQEVAKQVLAETYMELNGKKFWAGQVTIADDSVATLDLPVYAGFMTLTADAESLGTGNWTSGSYGTILNHTGYSDEFSFVVGTNAFSESLSPSLASTGKDVTHTTGVLTGTTGSVAVITISPQTNKTLMIENRAGLSITFDYFIR